MLEGDYHGFAGGGVAGSYVHDSNLVIEALDDAGDGETLRKEIAGRNLRAKCA